MKKVLNNIFIEGFSGMAIGIFPTLIIGLILTQIASLIGGRVGELLLIIGKIASSLTGAGIGIGIAVKFKSSFYMTGASAVTGLIGGFASQILAGKLLVNGSIILTGAGEPLGAFIAAFVGIQFGKLVSEKTKIDLLLTPAVVILTGASIGLLAGPPISGLMTLLGSVINWSVEQQPIIMGIMVSLIMGATLTGPLSSAALSIILNLSGLAAGAATVRVCSKYDRFCSCKF